MKVVPWPRNMTGQAGNKLPGQAYRCGRGAWCLPISPKSRLQAISLAQRKAAKTHVGKYGAFISAMEASGNASAVAGIYSRDDQLAERTAQGPGLTRGKLSVLISYSKGDLKEALVANLKCARSCLSGLRVVSWRPRSPPFLAKKYAPALSRHRLRREIIATQLANESWSNHMGITFLRRLEAVHRARWQANRSCLRPWRGMCSV